jgi:hypothetical protein
MKNPSDIEAQVAIIADAHTDLIETQEALQLLEKDLSQHGGVLRAIIRSMDAPMKATNAALDEISRLRRAS